MKKNEDKKFYLGAVIAAYAAFVVFTGFMAIPKSQIDFPTFYFPAKLAFEKGISPYNYAALQNAGSGIKQYVHMYLYPPAGLMLYYLLDLLPYEAAKIVMIFINHAMILLFLYLFFFRLMKIGLSEAFFIFSAIYLFLFYPCKVNIEMGQVNLVLLVLICLGWVFLTEEKHPALVAAPFAAALLLKLFPLAFLLYFLFSKKFKVFFWFVFYIAAACLVSVILLPAPSWPAWFSQVAPTLGYSKNILNSLSPALPWNVNVNGFTARLFMENNNYAPVLFPNKILAAIMPYIINFAIVAISCFVLLINAKNSRAVYTDGACVFLLLLYMTASYTDEMHLAYIIPVILILLYRAVESDRNYFFGLSLAAAVCLALPFPFMSTVFKNRFLSILLSFKFFILFAIWVYFIGSMWMQAGGFLRETKNGNG